MDSKLLSLFSVQGRCIDFKSYQNEFETMRLLFDLMPEKPKEFVRILSLQWLQTMEINENEEFALKDNDEKIQESKDLRQQGNRLFTAKGEQRNVLGACRLYNDAIYAALDTKGDELALGFANRATALQTFGYYQQAYDDCVCALKLGYPEALRHKIIIRQTYCSLKLKDLLAAEKHLKELSTLTLNEGFNKERRDLENAFDELKQEMLDKQDNVKDEKEVQLNRETQEVITTTKGRHMQAKCLIEKNQLIFTERASAFVAVGDTRRLCHQCGTVNFIPIPCLHCRGRVNYCSLKCQEQHSVIHKYECPAYRFQLFAHLGIAHLALRIVLDNGLFSILDELKLQDKSSTLEVWSALTEGGDIWANNNIPYAESLRMITHLNKGTNMDIEWFALVSHHLVVYLKQYTKYFEELSARNKLIDWELLTGSLILLHIGQCISNGHTLTTIIPRPLTLLTTTDYHLLNENVWLRPWHLKLGFMHLFSYYDDVACLNLPYLSLCNHSCVQSFQPKVSGRYISTFALRDIHQGEEITNCYDVDYRKGKREARRERLLQTYHFECQCENCLQTDNEDKEFNKFHQYRCDNSKCRQIFVPYIPEKPTLNWWQSDTPNGNIDTNLYCTVCGSKQNLRWYHEIKNLMYTVTESATRRRLYQIFKELEQYLPGLNDARCYVATKLVHEWFQLPCVNVTLNDQDYCDLIEMLKYVLNVTRTESSINSIEYIVNMTHMWDLIAKHKYKCSKTAMNEMLWAVNIIADDLKVIFLNYYNDYIKEYLDM
ncbi:SET and MYND domain-containing protein 4-like [Lucilia sericata]|uniref:SET and MYND domain-containing protein 4-like n=1 Tax=Lucilia sericata TaxID=13632 RepID=UPI0018A81454|nr:SET and MYND domain-containing protein 4-like [Lucilia sericata]